MDEKLRIKKIEEEIGFDPNTSLEDLLKDVGIENLDMFIVSKDKTTHVEDTVDRIEDENDIELR